MRLHRRTLLLVSFFCGTSAVCSANVTVEPVSITEGRSRQFNAPAGGGDKFRLIGQDLTLLVRLTGPEMDGAGEYGMLKVREAADDTGRSLIPAGENRVIAPDEQAFVRFRESEFETDPKASPKQFEIHLTPTDRKATKIASLKGQVQVRVGGEEKFATVANAKSLLGKKIEDPVLNDAKLTVRLLPVAKRPENTFAPEDAQWIDVEVKGNPAAVQKIEVLDEKERDLRVGSAIDDDDTAGDKAEDDVHHHRIAISRELDEKMSLKVTVRIGQKVILVPIELKDIALP